MKNTDFPLLGRVLPLLAALSAGGVAASDGLSITLGQDVVVTTRGRFSCPATAVVAGSIDLSLCSRDRGQGADDPPGDDRTPVVCLPAATVGLAAQTDDSTLSCISPGALFKSRNLGKFPSRCPGGGTRTVEGGWDGATGALDVVITLANCVDSHGATHNGTATMQGTLTSPSPGVWNVKDTKTVAVTVTFAGGGTLQRACTLTRNGVLNENTHVFQGKSTRTNCSLEGSFRYSGGLIDKLIDNASELEDF